MPEGGGPWLVGRGSLEFLSSSSYNKLLKAHTLFLIAKALSSYILYIYIYQIYIYMYIYIHRCLRIMYICIHSYDMYINQRFGNNVAGAVNGCPMPEQAAAIRFPAPDARRRLSLCSVPMPQPSTQM